MSLSPFLDLLDSTHPHPVVSPEQVSKWSQQFSVLTGLEVYPRSLAMSHLGVFFMAKKGHDKYLAIFSEARIPGFEEIREPSISTVECSACRSVPRYQKMRSH